MFFLSSPTSAFVGVNETDRQAAGAAAAAAVAAAVGPVSFLHLLVQHRMKPGQ